MYFDSPKEVFIMKMVDLIEQYKQKIKTSQNDYTCLLFALQIPSICSRIEFPQTSENTGSNDGKKLYRLNGKPWDANMYKAWLKEHKDSFVDIYRTSMGLAAFCDAVYNLRCKMTHEGVLMTDTSAFFFTNDDNAMSLGDIVFLPMRRLCEDMFDAALITFGNKNQELTITPFDSLFLSENTYSEICECARKTYLPFWNNYSDEDNLLNCIYEHIIPNNPNMSLQIDDFFKNQPSDIFEIWDFDLIFGCIIDLQQRFIQQKYDEDKSALSRNFGMDSNVLCLSKSEYERMLQVHQEFENFQKNLRLDILHYTKESK